MESANNFFKIIIRNDKKYFYLFTICIFAIIPFISLLISHQVLPNSCYKLITYIKIIILVTSSFVILVVHNPFKKLNLQNKVIISLFLYLLGIILFNYEIGPNYFRVFKLFFAYLLFFNYGYLLQIYYKPKLFSYIFVIFVILFMMLVDPFSLRLRTIHIIYASNHYSDYAIWALNFSILSILTVLSNQKYQYFIIILSAFILACLNSRSIFICYLVSLFIYLVLEKRYRVILIAITSVMALFIYSYFSDNQYFYKRYAAIINGTSSSLNQRMDQISHGSKDILENPIFGNFLGHLSAKSEILDFNHFGNYMHTYLSYWRQFGVYAFVVINLILFWAITKSYKDSNSRGVFIVFIFLSLLVITSKSFLLSELFIICGFLFCLNQRTAIEHGY